MKAVNTKKSILFIALAAPFAAAAQAQQTAPGYFSNALFNTLLLVIILLLLLIIALGSVLKNIVSSGIAEERFRKTKQGKAAGTLAAAFLLLSAGTLEAKGTAAKAGQDLIGGMDQTVFYFMVAIIAVEMLVAGILMHLIRQYVLPEETAAVRPALKKKEKTIFSRLNDAVEMEQEEAILLDHSYDGIRELDNNLPPWWKYGFYITILVAVVYMINYHITKTSPLQAEEYRLSVAKAEAEIAEYMKNSADNVDESSVKLLTDAAELASGKDVYMNNCAICHGKAGEGTVGPNLTDEYWLHSGGVQDIFKSIKYGWPDKGMKSWKGELSPKQIAQLTSYIKSLSGTNPPNAKEKQGEPYRDADVPAAKPDSLKTMAQVR
jgi:cytochrome c oxidase cbb3-type subunit III